MARLLMDSPLICLTEVEWREVGEYWTDGRIWPRNRTCPSEGEIRWCLVHLETQEYLNVGNKRWLLYQKENSLYNGISSPEELDALAIVEVEVLDVELDLCSQSKIRQWWKVRCLRAMPLASIPSNLPPISPIDLDDFRPLGRLECASENLYLYSWGTQVSEIKIYVQEPTPHSPTHLVFYQISIGNKCEIYNWPIK